MRGLNVIQKWNNKREGWSPPQELCISSRRLAFSSLSSRPLRASLVDGGALAAGACVTRPRDAGFRPCVSLFSGWASARLHVVDHLSSSINAGCCTVPHLTRCNSPKAISLRRLLFGHAKLSDRKDEREAVRNMLSTHLGHGQ